MLIINNADTKLIVIAGALFTLVVAFVGMFMNVNFTFIILANYICLQVILLEIKKESNLITFNIMFIVFWFFYANATVLDNFFDQEYLYGLNLSVYLLHILALLSYCCTYSVFRIRESNNIHLSNKSLINVTIIFSILMLAVQIYYLFIEYGINNFIYISRSERSIMLQSTGIIFPASKHVLFMCGPLLYLIYLRTNNKFAKFWSMIICLYNIAISLIVIDRSNLLQSVLPTLFLMMTFKKLSKKMLFLLLVIGFAILVDFKVLLSNLIFNGSVEFIEIKIPEEFFVSSNVCRDIIEKLREGTLEFIVGRSYFEGLVATAFPFIKIEPLSIWYIKNYYQDIYNSGGGLGFSAVGEAYLNFGVIGVMLYYCLLGYTVKYLNTKRKKNDLFLIIYSLAIPLGYKLFRSEFYSLIKTTLWFQIIPLILIYSISLAFNKGKAMILTKK